MPTTFQAMEPSVSVYGPLDISYLVDLYTALYWLCPGEILTWWVSMVGFPSRGEGLNKTTHIAPCLGYSKIHVVSS